MARRNTIQRSLVLEAVNRLHCHATADEVYEEIIQEYPTISKATVYRNLNLLSEMGEIRRLEIPGSADRFDHIAGRHFHFICRKCGSLSDVKLADVSHLNELCEAQTGAQVEECNIFFEGLCKNCIKE